MNKPIFNNLNIDESALSWKVNSVTRNSIELLWERRESLVEYLLTSTGEDSGAVIYQGPNTTFTIESLRSNTQYTYFISGVSAEGKRTKPTLVVGRTAFRAIPVAPTFFEAFGQTPTEVSFFWNPGVVDGGRLGYEIRRDGNLLETPSSPPYTDTTPQQGRDHVYCIRTFDDEFYFSEPHCINVPFPDFTAPTDPSNLSVSDISLLFRWLASYDSSENITYTVDQDGIELGATKDTVFAVTGLQPGQRYEFGVTASDNTGHKSNRITIQYPALGISLQRK